MNLIDLVTQVQTVKTDLTSGKPMQALKDFSTGLSMLADLGMNLGFQAGPSDEAACKEMAECLCDIQTLIAHPPASSEPKGKIGDGHILQGLKNLADLFIQYAPMILPLIAPFLGPKP